MINELLELPRGPQTAQGPGEATDALHALLKEGLGQGEGSKSGPEALGDRQDHRTNVEGIDRGREVRVRGGVRDGEGRVRPGHDAIQELAGLSG